MQTKLSLYLAIAHIFAKIKHTLVLSDVFNFLLNITKLMQAHFKIVQKVCHGVMEKIQTIYVKLVNLGSFKLINVLYVLILTFLQDLFRFSNFALEERYVLSQGDNFQ